MLTLAFPHFDPNLVQAGPFPAPQIWPFTALGLQQLGPFAIKYYALAYIVSLLIGWRVVRHLDQLPPRVCTPEQTDDFLTWATLGVVLGGRLGYVLFYQPAQYLQHPLAILQVWNGGMSFHGGMLGVLTAMVLYCRKYGLSLFGFSDRVCAIVPLGLGLGRLGNFINGELPGRIAPDWLPWGMADFPGHYGEIRHPSQLYEFGLEGVLLGAFTLVLVSRPAIRARLGTVSGCFLIGYGTVRIVAELFREPDPFLGFLWQGATMGQLLSLPMIVAGIAVLAAGRPPAPVAVPS